MAEKEKIRKGGWVTLDESKKAFEEEAQFEEEHFDLEESRKLIGKEIPILELEEYLANQPIEKSEIRRVAMLNRDNNPLWMDEEYAKKTRWGGIIAPPAFITSCYLGGVLGTSPIEVKGAPRFHWLYAGDSFEYFVPIRPGDKIRPRYSLFDIQEKVGRYVGPMVYSVSEVKTTNQKGELVCIHHGSLFRFSTKKAQERAYYKLPADHQWESDTVPVMGPPKITARGTTPLYYEDVNVGSEITPMTRKLTTQEIVAQGAMVSSRGGNVPPQDIGGLGCDWHYIPSRAWKVRAMPCGFDFGPSRHVWVSRLITDWIGDDGWLSKLDCRYALPIFCGDVSKLQGKVINKYVKDDKHLVDCEIWFENQRKEISTTATATAILPSRRS